MPQTPDNGRTPTNDERMDRIMHALERMDHRDRLRTYSAIVHGIISFIPTLLLLGSLWYLYAHGAELLKQMTTEATKQAAGYSAQQGGDLLKEFQKMMGR